MDLASFGWCFKGFAGLLVGRAEPLFFLRQKQMYPFSYRFAFCDIVFVAVNLKSL